MRGRRTHHAAVRLPSLALLAVILVAPLGTAFGWTSRSDAASRSGAAATSWASGHSLSFSSPALPQGCQAYTGEYTGGASVWTTRDVSISHGVLRLLLQHRRVADRGYTSGAIGCWGWAQTYGRYEVRAWVPRGRGIDSYLSLLPSNGAAGGWTGLELLAPGPDSAYVTNGDGKDPSDTATVPGRYSDGWHTYVIEWAPNLTQIMVDKSVIYSSPHSFRGPRWFGLVVSNGDALTGLPDSATKLPAQFQVDYVKISRYTGVAPVPQAVTPPLAAPSPSFDVGASASGQPAAGSTSPPAAAAAPPAATAAASATDEATGLVGGVWPWLLGGRVIAGVAVALLGIPGARRALHEHHGHEHHGHEHHGHRAHHEQPGQPGQRDQAPTSDSAR